MQKINLKYTDGLEMIAVRNHCFEVVQLLPVLYHIVVYYYYQMDAQIENIILYNFLFCTSWEKWYFYGNF